MNSPSIQMLNVSQEENSMESSKGETPKICKLTAQVHEINKRLTKLEENFNKWSSFFDLSSGIRLCMNGDSGEGPFLRDNELQLNKRDHSSTITALANLDHDLISIKSRNESFVQQMGDCIVVIKKWNFAMLQCLLIVVAAGLLLSFGTLNFMKAHDSVNDPYKPYKLDGRDEYFINDNLNYEFPLHYFWFHIRVNRIRFRLTYNWRFGEECETQFEDCLDRYMNDFFIDRWRVYCFMNKTANVDPIGVRNLTVHLTPHGTNESSEFEMLVRLEFNDFDKSVTGNVACHIEIASPWISPFAKFKLWLWVSRQEFMELGKNSIRSIPSSKQLWAINKRETSSVRYTYAFGEKTYDGKSEFTANLDLNLELPAPQPFVTVLVYPSNSVMHYSSFTRYSYLDCLADIGGLYTLVAGFYFIFAPYLVGYAKANRGHNAYMTHGILPVLSLSYRNAEEISLLRSLVFVALGITENEYFGSKVKNEASIKQEVI